MRRRAIPSDRDDVTVYGVPLNYMPFTTRAQRGVCLKFNVVNVDMDDNDRKERHVTWMQEKTRSIVCFYISNRLVPGLIVVRHHQLEAGSTNWFVPNRPQMSLCQSSGMFTPCTVKYLMMIIYSAYIWHDIPIIFR